MIVIKNVTLRRGTKIVLQDASCTLQPGEKVGLVGRNGAGKSSLFSLLTHRLQSDVGDVDIPPRWIVGEVAQSMPETDDSATDFVLQGDTRLMAAQAALEAAEASNDGHAMGDAHMAIAEAGGFDARARAQALLMGLGFRTDQLELPVNSFSGGWRMRLQLARALMCPADLMLLDEPTNHLDLDALVWLEAWLLKYEGTMIVISHDREFLDAITKVTLHLDQTQLTRYGGNYTAFEEMRAERLEQAQAQANKQQERMAHLQKFIDRFKAKASKAKQAQSRVKALARMEKLAPILTSSDFHFEFREPMSLPNPMLAFSMMNCGYNGLPIVKDINRSVLAGQRIGILGANGQGKSTLVKTIAKEIPLIAGEVTEGKGLSIGYFAQQELDVLQLDDGPLMHMIRLARDVGPAGREQELRDFLGSFRFVGDMVTQAVGSLSGGEKARLVLAMLVWQRPNLLLLDEPTNHRLSSWVISSSSALSFLPDSARSLGAVLLLASKASNWSRSAKSTPKRLSTLFNSLRKGLRSSLRCKRARVAALRSSLLVGVADVVFGSTACGDLFLLPDLLLASRKALACSRELSSNHFW